MASEAQIAANRRNAQHSTGPRTEAGKAASSRNGLKHGMTARSFIVFDESWDDFSAFADALRRDWEPQSAIEEEIVDRIVMAGWCLRRAWRTEAAAIDAAAFTEAEARARRSLAEGLRANPPPGRDAADEAALAVLVEERLRLLPREDILSFAAGPECGLMRPEAFPAALAQLTRYQAHHERTMQRAVAQLQRLRAERRREEAERREAVRAKVADAEFQQRFGQELRMMDVARAAEAETAKQSQFATAAGAQHHPLPP
jgi:hypothetical protein